MTGCAVDWGTVPQWLGLAAAIVAVTAFVVSRRDLSRTEASSVYVMADSHKYSMKRVDNDDGTTDRITSLELAGRIHNAASTPITDCTMHLYAPNGRRRLWWWTSQSPQAWWTTKRLIGRSYYTIAPESAGEQFEYHRQIDIQGGPPKGLPTMVTTFTDGHGRRWVRWPSGKLSRVRSPLMWRGRRKKKQR